KLDARRILPQRTPQNGQRLAWAVESTERQRGDRIRLIRIENQRPPRQNSCRVEHFRTARVGHYRQCLGGESDGVSISGVQTVRPLVLAQRPLVLGVRRRRILLVDALAAYDGGESTGVICRSR